MPQLKIEIYSRGQEVFGVTYPKSQFNEVEFMRKYEHNYQNLSTSSLESEVPLKGAYLSVEWDDKQVCNDLYQDGLFGGIVKVELLDQAESYRELLAAKVD